MSDELLHAVDTVCGECVDRTESTCESCPVRHTVDSNNRKLDDRERAFAESLFRRYQLEDVTGFLGALLDEASDEAVIQVSLEFCQAIYDLAAKQIMEVNTDDNAG